jgi:hypothetical protein
MADKRSAAVVPAEWREAERGADAAAEERIDAARLRAAAGTLRAEYREVVEAELSGDSPVEPDH